MPWPSPAGPRGRGAGGYLPGSWAVGSAEACAGTSERLTFGADGALLGHAARQPDGGQLLAARRGPAHAAWWPRPRFFDDPATDADDALAAHAGQYSYYFAEA
ncbi:MAG: hypothetical protein R3C69_11395 [Geminicoccaceae bacterium]